MKTKEQLAEEYYPNNLGVKISFCAGYDAALANIDWKEIEKEWHSLKGSSCTEFIYFIKSKIK